MRSTLLLAALFPAGIAIAGQIDLPETNGNQTSGICAQRIDRVWIRSEEGSWTLRPGERLVRWSPAGTEWSLICGGTAVRTNCFFDGYVIARFETGAMAVACYEGPVPQD